MLPLFASPKPTLLGSDVLIAPFSQPHEIAELMQYTRATLPRLISCYVTGYMNDAAELEPIRKALRLLTMR
jgi:hypothetical protein